MTPSGPAAAISEPAPGAGAAPRGGSRDSALTPAGREGRGSRVLTVPVPVPAYGVAVAEWEPVSGGTTTCRLTDPRANPAKSIQCWYFLK